MFIIPGKCPVCYASWNDTDFCPSCGSVAEIYYERDIPAEETADLARLQRVIDSARSRLTQFPNDGIAHYVLGMAYVHIDLKTEGAKEIKIAAELMPEKIQILYESAAISAQEGIRTEGVLADVNKVLERKPDFKQALFLRGTLLKKIGEVKASVRAWQNAYQLDKEYNPPALELHEFIASERQYIASPSVLQIAKIENINNTTIGGLKELTLPRPEFPPPMGKTSLQILDYIHPATAGRMKKLYAGDVQKYKNKLKDRERALRNLDHDLVSMADICLISYELRQRQPVKLEPGSVKVAGTLSIADRAAILDREIQRYQKNGYHLISRTDTTAQLHRQKQFSCCLAFILVILVIGIILYLIYYLTKKDDTVFIEVNEAGKIRTTYA